MTWMMVALGGALGSVGRFGLGQAIARFDAFPYGSLLANVLGSLVIGVCAGLFDAEQRSRPAGLFLMVGFCGGNVALSVALCLVGTWLGFLLGQSLRKTGGISFNF